MKTKRIALLIVVLLTAIAWAAPPETKQPGIWRFAQGIFIGLGWTAEDRQVARLGGAATIDFTAQSVGVQFSSAITKAGAAVGDICTVSAPAAASALLAKFSCVVTAADTVKVIFEPLSQQEGAFTLETGTPSEAVVAGITASSICTASFDGDTAAIAASGPAVSLTTTNLTITGPDSVTTPGNYRCAAPVDPASGSYAFVLKRNGA